MCNFLMWGKCWCMDCQIHYTVCLFYVLLHMKCTCHAVVYDMLLHVFFRGILLHVSTCLGATCLSVCMRLCDRENATDITLDLQPQTLFTSSYLLSSL